MTKRREAITKTIDRSSLGTPAARKLRARTTVHQRGHILRKASARTARDSAGTVPRSGRK